MIGPKRPRPAPTRVLGVERAAAVVGVSPDTLRTWAIEGVGPRPYLYGDDGHAVAWTVDAISAWREQRLRSRQRAAARATTDNLN